MTELHAPQLTAEQAIRIIIADIRAYPQNGPDKREKHIGDFGGLVAIEEINVLWAERYAELRKAKPNVVGFRRFAKKEQSSANSAESFSVPATQPPADAEGKDTARKTIVAKYIEAHRDDLAAAAAPNRKPDEEEPAEEPDTETKPLEAEIVASTQIALPITATAAKAVALLNQKHHVIGNYGNKCVVLSWELWEINRNVMIPTFQRFEDFNHRYMNRYVWRQTKTGLDKVPAGAFWLRDPGRITYDSVTFRPKEPGVLSGNRLNLWRGFGVVERKGSWKLMHDHIYDVLGAGDPEAGLYIIRWLAYTLQHPDVVGETVLVLQGDEGTGKGTLGRAMLRIFGPHGLPVTQPKHLVGGFSGHLQYCCFSSSTKPFGLAMCKPKAGSKVRSPKTRSPSNRSTSLPSKSPISSTL